MAILQRCCCFNNVRSGSTASAIYTLVYAAILLVISAYNIVTGAEYSSTGPLVVNYLVIAFICLIVVASIFAIIGVARDQVGFLLMYMIVMPMLILLQVIDSIMLISGIIRLSVYGFNAVILLVVMLMIYMLFTIIDVFCFLCVVSQCQELRDGRGRLADVMAARGQGPTSIVTTSVGGGTVVVATPGGAPPQYAGQGYPPQQGYHPQQGYPPQQGYSPQQGYPPEQGYPPQQGPPGYPEKV